MLSIVFFRVRCERDRESTRSGEDSRAVTVPRPAAGGAKTLIALYLHYSNSL